MGMTNAKIAAIDLMSQYFTSTKDIAHGLRVARYAIEIGLREECTDSECELLFISGLLHDIVEDTECTLEILDKYIHKHLKRDPILGSNSSYLYETIELLTKPENLSYAEYVKKIMDSENEYAKIVKRADMKDHFLQQSTLTDNLIKKYSEVIGYLL